MTRWHGRRPRYYVANLSAMPQHDWTCMKLVADALTRSCKRGLWTVPKYLVYSIRKPHVIPVPCSALCKTSRFAKQVWGAEILQSSQVGLDAGPQSVDPSRIWAWCASNGGGCTRPPSRTVSGRRRVVHLGISSRLPGLMRTPCPLVLRHATRNCATMSTTSSTNNEKPPPTNAEPAPRKTFWRREKAKPADAGVDPEKAEEDAVDVPIVGKATQSIPPVSFSSLFRYALCSLTIEIVAS